MEVEQKKVLVRSGALQAGILEGKKTIGSIHITLRCSTPLPRGSDGTLMGRLTNPGLLDNYYYW